MCNASGAFADSIRRMDNPECGNRILAVGGSHLSLSHSVANKRYGLIIPETSDGRVIFSLPW